MPQTAPFSTDGLLIAVSLASMSAQSANGILALGCSIRSDVQGSCMCMRMCVGMCAHRPMQAAEVLVWHCLAGGWVFDAPDPVFGRRDLR